MTPIQIQIMETIDPNKGRILRYYYNHRFCPNCMSEEFTSTLNSVTYFPNIIDNNQCFCKCGFKHTVHNRKGK